MGGSWGFHSHGVTPARWFFSWENTIKIWMNLGYMDWKPPYRCRYSCQPSHAVHLPTHLLFSVSRVELIDTVQLAISIVHDAWPSSPMFALRVLHVFLLEQLFVEAFPFNSSNNEEICCSKIFEVSSLPPVFPWPFSNECWPHSRHLKPLLGYQSQWSMKFQILVIFKSAFPSKIFQCY